MYDLKTMSLADLKLLQEMFEQLLTSLEKELGKLHNVEARKAKTEELESWRVSWMDINSEVWQRLQDVHNSLRKGGVNG